MKEGASEVGDQSATETSASFEEFFNAERPRLFATLALIVGDRGIAEDLMQEAFVRVWERWDRVQAHADPTGYLYRTALNLVRQRRRRALRAPRMDAPEIADAFAGVEERRDLVDALWRLTPRQRAALVFTELLDMDASEAARILHVRAATVRSLASQGRAAIRAHGGDEDE